MTKLKIEYLTADKITPYINNSRTHSEQQIQAIKASIKEFGMCSPIALHNGTIVYGHARFKAMQELQYTEFPTVDLSHLSEAQKKAYIIADNQLAISEGVGWDEELLKLEIEELDKMDFDLDLLGFDGEFFDKMTDYDSIKINELCGNTNDSEKLTITLEFDSHEMVEIMNDINGIKERYESLSVIAGE